ncbi:hypothetical protein PpBr36_04995 [Pyricularia pennisetigena]|uniref:hypothetical protein n=1 Tax=Pyricularia pennisetigena TaxID=1578925 RepID=UPI0011515BB8|nr:hypothetical protein PpBr36_04995 [Pyricularia pennisetigena]TLS27536.1 hypothetical protein PpBr36_04995 [Pyricularia pennisetigena]
MAAVQQIHTKHGSHDGRQTRREGRDAGGAEPEERILQLLAEAVGLVEADLAVLDAEPVRVAPGGVDDALPRLGGVHDGLAGVEDAAVGGLVQELQRQLGVVHGEGVLAVDAAGHAGGRGAGQGVGRGQDAHLAAAQLVRALLGRQRQHGPRPRGQRLHGEDLRALDAGDGLHLADLGAAADDGGAHVGLLDGQVREDGAGAAAGAVGQEHDVRGLEDGRRGRGSAARARQVELGRRLVVGRRLVGRELVALELHGRQDLLLARHVVALGRVHEAGHQVERDLRVLQHRQGRALVAALEPLLAVGVVERVVADAGYVDQGVGESQVVGLERPDFGEELCKKLVARHDDPAPVAGQVHDELGLALILALDQKVGDDLLEVLDVVDGLAVDLGRERVERKHRNLVVPGAVEEVAVRDVAAVVPDDGPRVALDEGLDLGLLLGGGRRPVGGRVGLLDLERDVVGRREHRVGRAEPFVKVLARLDARKVDARPQQGEALLGLFAAVLVRQRHLLALVDARGGQDWRRVGGGVRRQLRVPLRVRILKRRVLEVQRFDERRGVLAVDLDDCWWEALLSCACAVVDAFHKGI